MFGTGPRVGEALVSHPEVPLISFTGSQPTAERITQLSAPHCKKLSLELGGKNPAIIFEDANLEECIPTTVKSSFANQVCPLGWFGLFLVSLLLNSVTRSDWVCFITVPSQERAVRLVPFQGEEIVTSCYSTASLFCLDVRLRSCGITASAVRAPVLELRGFAGITSHGQNGGPFASPSLFNPLFIVTAVLFPPSECPISSKPCVPPKASQMQHTLRNDAWTSREHVSEVGVMDVMESWATLHLPKLWPDVFLEATVLSRFFEAMASQRVRNPDPDRPDCKPHKESALGPHLTFNAQDQA